MSAAAMRQQYDQQQAGLPASGSSKSLNALRKKGSVGAPQDGSKDRSSMPASMRGVEGRGAAAADECSDGASSAAMARKMWHLTRSIGRLRR